MPFAAGIKFSKDDFSVYYNPGDLKVETDTFCHVRDHRFNLDRVGFVSILEGRAPIQMEHLPKIGRLASESEIELWYECQVREHEGRAVARRRAREHNLDIKISQVTVVPDRQQVLIHFTSEKRIDFRALVRDLAGDFKSRIEMWQIGARQEAGTLSGMGVCGRELCCSSWLMEFPSVSMRHAKDQGIVQPPSKLSGPCNRLRCCLRYEHEVYLQIADDIPPVGCKGGCSFGVGPRVEGTVVERHLLRGEVVIEKSDGERVTVAAADFLPDPKQSPAARARARHTETRAIEVPVEEDGDTVVLEDEPGKPIRPARERGRGTADREGRRDQGDRSGRGAHPEGAGEPTSRTRSDGPPARERDGGRGASRRQRRGGGPTGGASSPGAAGRGGEAAGQGSPKARPEASPEGQDKGPGRRGDRSSRRRGRGRRGPGRGDSD